MDRALPRGTWHDDRDSQLRRLRGEVYLAKARVERLTHAWPKPNDWQQKAIDEALNTLARVSARLKEVEGGS